jgi:hypothetical protein
MMIKSFDEFDLQRKIKNIMNNKSFKFEKQKANYFCDLADTVNKIYCEVKEGKRMASAQILYGLVKYDIKDAKYVALATQFEIRFFETPDFSKMEKFARNISPNLTMKPSEIHIKYDEEAFTILGEYTTVYNYKGKFEWNQKLVFLTEDNYDYIRSLFERYKIDSSAFINMFNDVYSENGRIIYMDEKLVKDVKDSKDSIQFIKCSTINYKGDRQLIENIRIKAEDYEKLTHKMDTLKGITKRREHGQFFTERKIADIINQVIEVYIEPDFIIEPYCGTGTLISKIMDEYNGFANDIDKGYSDSLTNFVEGTNWKVYNFDFVEKPINEILNLIPNDCKKLLILSNPPFGTSSTNKTSSKKDEIKNGEIRKNKINYFGLDKVYGKGDLIIPTTAKMIEVIKTKGSGYLGFFSPLGIFCERKRYLKLLTELLKNFKFIDGYIFSGENFNGVAKNVAIQFSLWEYHENCNTDILKTQFNCEDKLINFKRTLLLKDGWRYRDGSKYAINKIENPLGIMSCPYFNNPTVKIFSTNFKEGMGAELISENIKIDLQIQNIPSELIYGLWSTTIGKNGISKYPLYFNDAYTHLPNFQLIESKQILAYTLIFDLIKELTNNYCKGKIGFIGMQRIFKFGENPELTKGCEYLINTYGNCIIDLEKNYTIKSVFEWLKKEPDIKQIDSTIRVSIRNTIETLLKSIGYYDFIPLPLKNEDTEEDE